MKKHPVKVEGFDGSLEDLAKLVCRLRYDKASSFFEACAEELSRQARADARRTRMKLAHALHGASKCMLGVQFGVTKAFNISAPFMREELRDDPEYVPGK